jgi:hypothetical protein
MKTLKINYLAVLVILILGQLIPMGWYSAFQKPWMKYNNLTIEMGNNGGMTPYIASIIYAGSLAWVLAWIFKRMNIQSAMDGLKTGFLMGVPMMLFYSMMQNLFAMRPYPLSWIDGGYGIILFSVSGLILGGWRKYDSNSGATAA